MSLLRVAQRAVAGRRTLLSTSSLARHESTAAPQADTEVTKASTEWTEIEYVPPREVVPADIVSGAPSVFSILLAAALDSQVAKFAF